MNQYFLVSQLQKSLRRADSACIPTAAWLLKNARSYFYYRLSIILIEDFGAAIPATALPFLMTQMKKQSMHQLATQLAGTHSIEGTPEQIMDQWVLGHLLPTLLNTPKDRTFCDLSYFCLDLGLQEFFNLITPIDSTLLPLYQRQQWGPFYQQLTTLFFNEQAPLLARQIAFWMIYGMDKTQIHPISAAGSAEHLEFILHTCQEKLSWPMVELFKSLEFQKEPIFLSIPLLSLCLHQHDANFKLGTQAFSPKGNTPKPFDYSTTFIETKQKTIDQEPYTLLACAADWHTREGKNAIYQTAKLPESKAFFKQFNVPFEKQAQCLAKCLFLASGHTVNQRLYYPEAFEIYQKAYMRLNYFTDAKPKAFFQAFCDQVLPSLEKAQEQALQLVLQPTDHVPAKLANLHSQLAQSAKKNKM